MLAEGIVALDANVLLDLYRYGEEARDEFFAVLGEVERSLWIPHQVIKEFWRNRVAVVTEVGASALVPDLRKARDAATTALTRWRVRTRAHAEADECASVLEAAFERVAEVLAPVAGLDAEMVAVNTNTDPVLRRLEPLLSGRVGVAPGQHRLDELIAEGVARAQLQRPPGYMDAEKHGQTEKGTGDFLLWTELLERAAHLQSNVLLVTRDEKEDWWALDGRRRLLGPRVELVQEMLAKAGVAFILLRPEQLLRVAADVLGVQVGSDTIEETSRISRLAGNEADEDPHWTVSTLRLLLDRLKDVGAHVQAAVIVAAAAAGGWTSRERIFELGGYDENRQLKGFTRPVRGVVDLLIEQGSVAETIAMPLQPTYSGPGKAQGFEVPEDLVQAFAELQRVDQPTWIEAARQVMHGSDAWWSIAELVEAIRMAGLRDMSFAKTPDATLRRDLRHRASDRFEEQDGLFRLRADASTVAATYE